MLSLVLALAGLEAPREFPVWPGEPPLYRDLGEIQANSGRLNRVSTPTLTHFPAQGSKTGAAIIICPGGAYSILAVEHEGYQVAQKYASKGIDAFVLKYRLPADGSIHPAPIWDALMSVRRIRLNAGQYGLDKRKVGILGFSAGGHLAASASSLWNRFPAPGTDGSEDLSRPSFSILVYPVISFTESFAHRGSRNNLLGDRKTDNRFAAKLSPEQHVTAATPPAFLAHSLDDKSVRIENSRVYHEALRKSSVSTELREYDQGGHGFGLGRPNQDSSAWFDQSIDWLKRQGLL
jgi:acetyl esterase/lipase